jgi:hypothetical protein
MKRLLIVMEAIALLAGCSSDRWGMRTSDDRALNEIQTDHRQSDRARIGDAGTTGPGSRFGASRTEPER